MATLFWIALSGLGVACCVWLVWLLWRVLGVACGIAAKAVCSGVFVSGRSASAVCAQDLAGIVPRLFFVGLHTTVDRTQGTVTCRAALFSGAVTLSSRVAVFVRRSTNSVVLGSAMLLPRGTIVPTAESRGILTQAHLLPALPRAPDIPMWASPCHPRGHLIHSAVMRSVFGPERRGRGETWGTRAVVVVHGGRIVSEAYHESFGRDTPLPVWSIAKSLLNAMIAARVKQGRMSVDDIVPLGAATGNNSPLRATVAELMRMRDVLMCEENFYPLGALPRALFESGDAAASALSHGTKPVASTSGWRYSSCLANVLSKALRDTFPNDAEYRDFVHRFVFAPAGMTTATLEYDASGTAVASSFALGTARDWARFGMLYLPNDHTGAGAAVLPPGWLDFTSRPAPGSCGGYGALWWLGGPAAGAVDGGLHDIFWAAWPWRSATPAGTLIASGLEGQAIVVVPSHDLVVVRLGRTPVSPVGVWHKSNARLVSDIVEALSSV